MTSPPALGNRPASGLTGAEMRALARAGRWQGTTSGAADGWAQANLVILPSRDAFDFLRFCALNPRACPVLDVTEVGSPEASHVAPGSDLRTDVPRYRVYRHGRLEAEVDDLLSVWRSDLVGFLLGCSFTFEAALVRAGVGLRHVELGRTVPMYRTGRACVASGPFVGPLVVTMRPVRAELVPRAVQVSGRFPHAHGAPVHVGDPSGLGIADLERPDFGDPVPVYPGEVPVFWACGVTPQAVAEAAGVELMLTHAPGQMFVTDVRDEDLAEG